MTGDIGLHVELTAARAEISLASSREVSTPSYRGLREISYRAEAEELRVAVEARRDAEARCRAMATEFERHAHDLAEVAPSVCVACSLGDAAFLIDLGCRHDTWCMSQKRGWRQHEGRAK